MTTNTKQFEKVSKPETELGHKHTATQQPEYKIGDWLHPRQAAGNLAIQRFMKQRLRVYPKLQVNQSTNAYEQEADSVAEKISRADDATRLDVTQRTNSTATTNTSSPFGIMIDQGLRETRGNGQSLPLWIGESMGERLGADFSDVRIHSDAKAHQISNSFGANAFTQGKDIYFNAGKYDPTSQEGNRLLTHELAHVVQQGDTASEHVQ